jgi:hypothetical protein
MQDYNRMIANEIDTINQRYITETTQPTMFGGRRLREYVLPGNVNYAYPSTLAVAGGGYHGGYDSSDDEMDGAGFFDDVARGFTDAAKYTYNLAKPIIEPVYKEVRKHGKKQYKKLVKEGQDKATNRIKKEQDKALNKLKEGIDYGTDRASQEIDKFLGSGMKRGRKKKGAGFFDDFARGFTDAAKFTYDKASPIVVPLVEDALIKGITKGAGRKKRISMKAMKEGGALYKANDMNTTIKPTAPLESYEPRKELMKGTMKRGGASKFVKGSQAAKDHMARIRAMRKK